MKRWQKIVLILAGVGLIAVGIWWFQARQVNLPVPQVEVKEKEFTIAVMADIHSDWENLKQGLDTAKNDGVTFAILVGDLTTVGKKEELLAAKKILDDSTLPYYAISGNHDVYLSTKMKTDLFAEVFGSPVTSFEKNNFLFILIPQGQLPDKSIERCQIITCLVFVHEPPYHPTSEHIMEPERSLRLLRLLKENQVKTIFTGHLHYGTEYEFDGLKTIITGALGSERNLQSPRFIEYEPLTQTLKTVILN